MGMGEFLDSVMENSGLRFEAVGFVVDNETPRDIELKKFRARNCALVCGHDDVHALPFDVTPNLLQ